VSTSDSTLSRTAAARRASADVAPSGWTTPPGWPASPRSGGSKDGVSPLSKGWPRHPAGCGRTRWSPPVAASAGSAPRGSSCALLHWTGCHRSATAPSSSPCWLICAGAPVGRRSPRRPGRFSEAPLRSRTALCPGRRRRERHRPAGGTWRRRPLGPPSRGAFPSGSGWRSCWAMPDSPMTGRRLTHWWPWSTVTDTPWPVLCPRPGHWPEKCRDGARPSPSAIRSWFRTATGR
jgi:hypothetical protein